MPISHSELQFLNKSIESIINVKEESDKEVEESDEEKEVEEAEEEMMSAEEFFAEADDEIEKSDKDEVTESDEEKTVDESDEDELSEEEKKLDELYKEFALTTGNLKFIFEEDSVKELIIEKKNISKKD